MPSRGGLEKELVDAVGALGNAAFRFGGLEVETWGLKVTLREGFVRGEGTS